MTIDKSKKYKCDRCGKDNLDYDSTAMISYGDGRTSFLHYDCTVCGSHVKKDDINLCHDCYQLQKKLEEEFHHIKCALKYAIFDLELFILDTNTNILKQLLSNKCDISNETYFLKIKDLAEQINLMGNKIVNSKNTPDKCVIWEKTRKALRENAGIVFIRSGDDKID